MPENRSSQGADAAQPVPLKGLLIQAPFPTGASRLSEIDRASTVSGAARATHDLICIIIVVIHGQFLALSNRSQTHVQDVPLHDPRGEVRLTRMVDELRPGATDTSVDNPGIVEDKEVTGTCSLLGLKVINSLAGILNHLPVRGNILAGVNAPPVDSGLANHKTKATVSRFNSRESLLASLEHAMDQAPKIEECKRC